jgi:hypothetical protein
MAQEHQHKADESVRVNAFASALGRLFHQHPDIHENDCYTFGFGDLKQYSMRVWVHQVCQNPVLGQFQILRA